MILTMILAIISLVIGIMVLAGMWGQHVSPPTDLRELPSDGVYDYCPVCGERLQDSTQAVMSHVIKCVLTYVDQKT
jgi:hypothetical protein